MNFSRSIRQALAATALTLAAALPAQAANTAFSGAAVAGCSYANQTYTCASLPLPNYNDSVSIASGYTVVVTSSVYIGYNQGLTMSGSAALQSSGDLNIGDINPANLAVSGGALTAGGTFSIGAQAQTITANITATTMNIGTGSATKITGSLTSSGAVALASNVTIVGPISGTTVTTNSPVNLTGNVTASTAFTLASGSKLVGNVTGGALTLSPASSSITGNVNMTGDVDIGSGDNITGNLVAHNVTTESSNAYISGNASVNHLTLNYGGYVGGTITCTAPAANGCSCVDYSNSGRPAPTACSSAAPPATFDHIQITQGGSGLTCQPATVTLTACANASCSAVYSTNAQVTTQPGGQPFNLTNGVNTTATVQQSTAGIATLSATTAGITTASTCVNTSGGTPCAMTFADTGFVISSPSPATTVGNFVSGATAPITITALQKASNGSTSANSCKALLSGTQSVNLSCAYQNPANGTLAASINGTSLAGSNGACSASGVPVSLTFGSSGAASANLTYNDVGQLTLSASYQGTPGKVIGTSNSFIVAPAAFQFVVTTLDTPPVTNPGATAATGQIFMQAGHPFSTKLSAVNSAGNVTPNFGNETSPESFTSTQSLKLPNTTTDHNPSVTLATMVNGVSTNNAMVWNEVGSFGLDATLTNTRGYLNSGLTPVKGSVVIGRFIPDHFETALQLVNNVPMSCSLTSPAYSIANCPPSKQAVYSNQPFAVAVTAKGPSSSGVSATLLNYYGQLASDISFSGWTSAGSTTASQKNPPSASSVASGSIAKALFVNGVAPAPSAAPQMIRYAFVTPANSNPPAPLPVFLRAIDGDLTTTTGASSTEQAVLVVSGRLLTSNNYGSETSPMPVTLKAQYWNGTAYVNSVSDNNSTGYALTTSASSTSAAVTFTNCTQHLATGAAAGIGQPNCSAALKLQTSPPSLLKFSSGATQFMLLPPGSGNTGAVDIALGTVISPYLTSFLPSVSGRSVFGVYRSGPVIYLREVY